MTDSAVRPKQILEALLFAADEPLSARRIAGMIDEATPGSIADLVRDLNADYLRQNRAFHVQEIAGGYRLVTRPEFATWIGDLRASDSSPRLSQAALETLSIVAYKQPVTRAELESIRGVTVEGVLKTLVDRELFCFAEMDHAHSCHWHRICRTGYRRMLCRVWNRCYLRR